MSRLVVVSRLVAVLLVAALLALGACDGDIGGPVGPESGANSPDTPLRSNGFIYLPPVCDDAGVNDVPEQSDLNCFSRADNVANRLGVEWSWDDTDVWTGTGQTGDACGLFDTDGDGFANLAVCAQFTNSPDGLDVIQLPSTNAAIAYECSDKKDDRCSKQVRLLNATELGTTKCTVTRGPETAPWQGDDYPYDVIAECDLDLVSLPSATNTNLINVCSYPSGEPNSNPFDCVITPGAGYLVIRKATTPTSADSFSFTLNPSARDGTTAFKVPGSDGSGGPGSSALIAVAPGSYSITETVPSGWTLDTASCSPGTGSLSSPTLSGISVATGQTVTCTFGNSVSPGITVTKTPTPSTVPETGGEVAFGLVVTNTSAAALTLNSLSDDVFGNVADAANTAIDSTKCSVPQSLAAAGQPGASYSCSFYTTLTGNASNGTHQDIITAGASSAAGSATAKDTAIVIFTDVKPSIQITKTPSPDQVPETGGAVNYALLVTNLAAEAVTLNSLVDDKFGNVADVSNPVLTSTTCTVPQSLTASGGGTDTYSCNFTATISGTPGVPHVNEVIATASDNDNNTVADTAQASVGIGAVEPTIQVTKTASPGSVPETGGPVTYTVLVDNTSGETITLNSLTDDKFGNLDGKGNCAMPQTLQPQGETGDSYSCTFTETVSGEAGSHINVATASGQDDDGQPVTGSDDETVTLTDVLPDISVTKTPNPASVPETGGDVTFGVQVTNNSAEAATLISLSDDQFGDLNGQGTCSVPQSLAASGGSYSCSFTKTLSSLDLTAHDDTVTAVARDNENNTDTEKDDATVTFTDVLPDISVTKTANPTTVPETGGDVTFTVTVANNSLEPVSLTSLVDDVFGDLNGQGDCSVPQALAATGEAGASYQCSFVKTLSDGSGGTHEDTVTAVGTDNENNTDTEEDDATVTFSDVAPTISIVKTASPTSVPETGGSVTFSVLVTNTGAEAVTLDSLRDDVFGDVADGSNTAISNTTCSLTQSLPASGGSYSCSFTATISGQQGTVHVNDLLAAATDDDDSEATASDTAGVTFTDVFPDITVTKTVSPTELGGTSATLTGPPPPAPGSITIQSGVPLYVPPVYDVDGVNDVPEQSDLNWFTRADNVAGELWVKWTWDDTDQWTGTGQTGDACGLFDTNGNGFADLAVCAQITNNADGSQVLQLPSYGAATAYACSDKKSDRCSKQVTLLTSIGSTGCTVNVEPEPLPGAPWSGDDGADVVAECGLDLGALGAGSSTNLLNVCSFPSGEPNSNPFDCIVTPGAGFLLVEKDATPATSQSFGFTLSPAAANGTTAFSVTGGSTSALIPVMPGQYSVTESSVANWTISSAGCTDGTNSTGTYNGSNAVTGIQVDTGETVTCGFANVWGLSAPVTYTIVVANNSLEAATLNYLNDDIFGPLSGEGSCSLNQSLAPTGQPGASYTCSFVKTLSGGSGTTHTNVVTAKASDDDGNTDTETDDATVTFTGP
jgi:hypothetical protein